MDSKGRQALGYSQYSFISGNGCFVALSSYYHTLVDDEYKNPLDIFVYDRLTKPLEPVSVASDGNEANIVSSCPAISADGRFVAFQSYATNLISTDNNRASDIFVRDRKSVITERVSVSAAGDEANGESEYPEISADGRFISFHSFAANLVPDDTNESSDIFVAPNPLFHYIKLNEF